MLFICIIYYRISQSELKICFNSYLVSVIPHYLIYGTHFY